MLRLCVVASPSNPSRGSPLGRSQPYPIYFNTVLKSHKASGLVTLVDRRSGYLSAARPLCLSAQGTARAMVRLLEPRRGDVKTITLDNCSEFSGHLAETGSFSIAAERLNTVQSNVTAHIKKLEEELSVQLIDRNGRAKLTSAGHTLVRYAQRILTAHDEALDLFQGRESPRGLLRLGATKTTMALRLPPVLANLHTQHAEADIQLQTGPTVELIGLARGC